MIITGAASGIGRAVAELAAETLEEAHLFLLDRDELGLEETMAAVVKHGAKVDIAGVDLADVQATQAVTRQGLDRLGGLDSLISNAGILRAVSLLDIDVASFDAMFDINTRATWVLAKAAHAALARSRGSVVATASISSVQPSPGLGTYGPSKAALVMLVQQMAVEWGRDGIRCNCVSPGPTFTGMTAKTFNDENDPKHLENRHLRESFLPLAKIGTPREVAQAILFLAGPASSQITGVNLNVDGGQSLALMKATGGGSGHKAG